MALLDPTISESFAQGAEYNPEWAIPASNIQPEVKKENLFDKFNTAMSNPGVQAILGRVGSILSGQKTPIGQIGTMASEIASGKQYTNAYNKMVSQAMAGQEPKLDSNDMIGLSAEQVKDLYGKALDYSKASMEKGTKEASERYMDQLTGASKAEQERKAKADVDWEAVKTRWRTNQVKRPSYIDDEVAEILYGLDSGKATDLISDLAKESKRYKGAKLGHVADTNEGNLITYNQSDEIIEVPDGKGGTRKILPGGEVNRITIGKKAESDSTKSWQVTKAESFALTDMLPEIKEAYFKSFGNNAKTAEQFSNLQAMLGDPLRAEQARTSLLSAGGPKMMQRWLSRVDQYTRAAGNYANVPAYKKSEATPAPTGIKPGLYNPKGRELTKDIASRKAKELTVILKRKPTEAELFEELRKLNYKISWEGT